MTTTTEKNIDTKASAAASPPLAKLRIGLINGSIWQRVTTEGTFYSVSFERRYRDSEGNWQTSHSFNTEDLLSLAKLADQAHTKILELRAGREVEVE